MSVTTCNLFVTDVAVNRRRSWTRFTALGSDHPELLATDWRKAVAKRGDRPASVGLAQMAVGDTGPRCTPTGGVAFGLTAVGVVGAAAESDSRRQQGLTRPSDRSERGSGWQPTVLGSSPASQDGSGGFLHRRRRGEKPAPRLQDVTSDLTAQGISVTNTWDGEITGLTATLDDAARDALEARDDIVAVEPDQPIELSEPRPAHRGTSIGWTSESCPSTRRTPTRRRGWASPRM